MLGSAPLSFPRWRDACCAGGQDGLLQKSRRACPLHISHAHTHHLSIINAPQPPVRWGRTCTPHTHTEARTHTSAEL